MHALALCLVNACLSWALPFAASFCFFNKEGELQISEKRFSSLMTVFFSFFAALLLRPVLLRVVLPMPATRRARGGIYVGVFFLLINYTLDLNVFIPLVRLQVLCSNERDLGC